MSARLFQHGVEERLSGLDLFVADGANGTVAVTV
jgi:hypothetical protein